MPKLAGGRILSARPRLPRHIGHTSGIRYGTRRIVRSPVGGVVGGAGGTVKSGIGTGGAASVFEILFASIFLADMGDVLGRVCLLNTPIAIDQHFGQSIYKNKVSEYD